MKKNRIVIVFISLVLLSCQSEFQAPLIITGLFADIAAADKQIRLYSTYSNEVIAVLEAHTSWVRSVAFYNNDRSLVSCGDDRRIYQWNLNNMANIRKLSYSVAITRY